MQVGGSVDGYPSYHRGSATCTSASHPLAVSGALDVVFAYSSCVDSIGGPDAGAYYSVGNMTFTPSDGSEGFSDDFEIVTNPTNGTNAGVLSFHRAMNISGVGLLDGYSRDQIVNAQGGAITFTQASKPAAGGYSCYAGSFSGSFGPAPGASAVSACSPVTMTASNSRTAYIRRNWVITPSAMIPVAVDAPLILNRGRVSQAMFYPPSGARLLVLRTSTGFRITSTKPLQPITSDAASYNRKTGTLKDALGTRVGTVSVASATSNRDALIQTPDDTDAPVLAVTPASAGTGLELSTSTPTAIEVASASEPTDPTVGVLDCSPSQVGAPQQASPSSISSISESERGVPAGTRYSDTVIPQAGTPASSASGVVAAPHRRTVATARSSHGSCIARVYYPYLTQTDRPNPLANGRGALTCQPSTGVVFKSVVMQISASVKPRGFDGSFILGDPGLVITAHARCNFRPNRFWVAKGVFTTFGGNDKKAQEYKKDETSGLGCG